MHLALWYVVLVCHQYDVYKNYVVSECNVVSNECNETTPCLVFALGVSLVS